MMSVLLMSWIAHSGVRPKRAEARHGGPVNRGDPHPETWLQRVAME